MKLLFIGDKEDQPFAATLKSYISGHSCLIYCGEVTTKAEVLMLASKHGIEGILTTNGNFIKLLSGNKKATTDKYAGSIFHPSPSLEVLVIEHLQHTVTTTTGKHLLTRYIEKLTRKDKWFKQTELSWEIANESTIASLYERFQSALFVAVDIETRKDNLRITCVGYCAVFIGPDGEFKTYSIVIPFTSEFFVAWCEKFNNLAAAKIMQNGQYDNSYFIRFGIPPLNYLWDTLNLFHCWYSEMPKTLDFLTAYVLRDFIYWKDEAEDAQNLQDYYFYNAKDTWATANSFLAIIMEAPAWALKNYLIEFPTIFPCLHAAMEGIAIDKEERDKLAVTETAKLDEALDEVRASLGSPAFNPGSPVQVKKLLQVLGAGQITSTNAKDLKKAALFHPLNDWFISRIIQYREAKKLLSSYLDASLLNDRYMYSLSPAGTDTGRLASKESAFWCGGNIQNTPIDVKSMYLADTGWLLAEVDYSQSEARCVAYLSGDEKLIEVVESDKDYHAQNAAMFFGVSYDDVLQEEKNKKKNNTTGLTTRDLSKRTNHGANYNMGAGVMLDTMGLTNVLRAKALLRMPVAWNPKQVCQFLLDAYARSYPHVKGRWYDKIKADIACTKLLVSPLGWTRYCFGNPAANKQALNSYVAHVPQNLSVSIINIAFMRVWQQFVLTGRIRIKAQIHDSLLFQYRIGDEKVVEEVAAVMRIPVEIIGSDGKKRLLVIPSDTKAGLDRWRKKK
jgi:DNA polymerase I-like protein with 3'-5' exonuclease and polymerase domains